MGTSVIGGALRAAIALAALIAVGFALLTASAGANATGTGADPAQGDKTYPVTNGD